MKNVYCIFRQERYVPGDTLVSIHATAELATVECVKLNTDPDWPEDISHVIRCIGVKGTEPTTTRYHFAMMEKFSGGEWGDGRVYWPLYAEKDKQRCVDAVDKLNKDNTNRRLHWVVGEVLILDSMKPISTLYISEE